LVASLVRISRPFGKRQIIQQTDLLARTMDTLDKDALNVSGL
jgi:hypothetical protein